MNSTAFSYYFSNTWCSIWLSYNM